MKKSFSLFLLILCTVFTQAAEVRLQPEILYIEAAGIPEPLDADLFIRIGLAASGLTPDNVEIYEARYRLLADSLIADMPNGFSDYEKAEWVLAYLHENLFTEYSLRQTSLDTLFDTGVFNCVSSALVYMYSLKRLGMTVSGVYAGDHAFCAVEFSDRVVDVETTNPFGFDPGTKKEFKDSFSGSTGYTYVPPQQYHLRAFIGEKEMLGFVLQNRIAANQHRNIYTESVGLALDRYILTGSTMGKRDFLTSVRNLIVEYNENGEFIKAIDFLLSVPEDYGVMDEPAMIQLLNNLGYNYIVSLVNTENLMEAGRFLADSEEWERLYGIDRQNWILMAERKKVEIAVREDPMHDALEIVEQSFIQGLIPVEQWKQSLIYLYSKEADVINQQEGPLEASRFIDSLPQERKQWNEIKRLRDIYRHNFAVSIHNQFADYFNQGDYATAGAVLRQGLEHVPDDHLLIQDKDYLIRVGAWD